MSVYIADKVSDKDMPDDITGVTQASFSSGSALRVPTDAKNHTSSKHIDIWSENRHCMGQVRNAVARTVALGWGSGKMENTTGIRRLTART